MAFITCFIFIMICHLLFIWVEQSVTSPLLVFLSIVNCHERMYFTLIAMVTCTLHDNQLYTLKHMPHVLLNDALTYLCIFLSNCAISHHIMKHFLYSCTQMLQMLYLLFLNKQLSLLLLLILLLLLQLILSQLPLLMISLSVFI